MEDGNDTQTETPAFENLTFVIVEGGVPLLRFNNQEDVTHLSPKMAKFNSEIMGVPHNNPGPSAGQDTEIKNQPIVLITILLFSCLLSKIRNQFRD